ncbi:hypothetical protein LAD12857_34500 [Lacrimispora amygdalina]|uniref:TadE-like domain-containing protein n=1 Tax=Lacrimispora amygdalina TaxID=253257 RepID=A0ABQ5M9U8_9FIRM
MKSIKKNSGQALVEMALVLPLLILLVCGIVEFGRIYNANLVVTNASREGARKAVVGGSDSEILSAVNTAAQTLNSASMTVTITPSQINRYYGEQAEVQISYNLSIVTPVFSSLLPNPFPVSAKTVMRVE